MKVWKVGILKGDEFAIGGQKPGIFARILTEIQPDEDYTVIGLPIILGTGTAQREIKLEIPIHDSVLQQQASNPVNFSGNGFILEDSKHYAAYIFKNQLFLASADFLDDDSEEMAMLLIKKQVLTEDKRINRLRQEVEAIERVVEQVEGPRRIPIPDDVKLIVWARDNGRCVKCSSTQNLHFDHIIPVSKGGGNSEANIQILCERCNLQKSNKIAF